MRKSLLLVFLFFTAIRLYSQAETDSSVYNKGLKLLYAANTAEKYSEAAGYFARVAEQNPSHWLANYYTALSYILGGQLHGDQKFRDALLDKAQPFIDRAQALKRDDPENLVLQALLYQVRLQIEPEGRAITMSQKAESILKKAIAVDSANPRAYFLLANNIYYTPAVFKGGAKNALPVFMKAEEKFRDYKVTSSFLPDWGRTQNEEMIRQCNKEKNKSSL
ncbi:MAG TPA: hypothetical protein VK179_00245 [Bacteroidales bacterium]|nr:hypothetical protein [Bacteroidales bacterium]